MDPVTATDLRSNLYRLLDQVIATGETLTVKRGQHVIEVRPSASPAGSPLDRLVPHPGVVCPGGQPLASPWDETAWTTKWDERLA